MTGRQIRVAEPEAAATTGRPRGEELIRSLAAAADAVAERHDLADLTRKTYNETWAAFQDCCAAMGLPARPTSVATLTAFLAWCAGERPGSPPPNWSASYVDTMLAAVSDFHRRHGHPDPTRHPDIRELRPWLRRLLAGNGARGPARPAHRDDVRQLVGPWPQRTVGCSRREAALLLRYQHGLSDQQLAAIHRDTARQDADAVRLRVGGREITARCRCAGSAVRACLHCATALLLRDAPHPQLLVPERHTAPAAAAWQSLLRAARPVAEVLSGDRPGRLDPLVVLFARPAAVSWLRARAWVLTGWHKGRRAGDLRDLRRGDVSLGGQDAAVLSLRRAKEDPLGVGTDLTLQPGPDPLCCPVAALRDWLGCRDAVAQVRLGDRDDGFVFCRLSHAGRPLPERALSAQGGFAMWRALRQDRELPELTTHSLRVGFIATATEDGADTDAISFTVGHARTETTFGYQRAEQAERVAQPLARAVQGLR